MNNNISQILSPEHRPNNNNKPTNNQPNEKILEQKFAPKWR